MSNYGASGFSKIRLNQTEIHLNQASEDSSVGRKSFAISRFENGIQTDTDDFVATEAPIEIRINGQKLSITMRTPGHDEELALGFLFTEGMIQDIKEVQSVKTLDTRNSIESSAGDILEIQMNDKWKWSKPIQERQFVANSSCGVCGKSSLAEIYQDSEWSKNADFKISSQVLLSLPNVLRQKQELFQITGGLHASALFDPNGQLCLLREDVGRHNALDKVIGSRLKNGMLPISNQILLVSGRASFELVQKASMAGICMMAAVGPPSSFAVELANKVGMSLIGFLRDQKFNIYSGPERVIS